MRVLLTDSKGQLAQCFRDRLPDRREIISTDSAFLDITDAITVFGVVQNFQPDAIVNTVVYTTVDKAEREYRETFAVNTSAVHNPAATAYEAKVRFTHIPTDYVFESDSENPYSGHNIPNPRSIYGRSKLSGEFLTLTTNPESIVVRTAQLFSEYEENFVKTVLRLAKERDTLSVVNDQIDNPAYVGDLAQALIDILKSTGPARDIYHFCGDESVSWYEFAQAIFQTTSENIKSFKVPGLRSIPSGQCPAPAPRPAYSVLDCGKINRDFGVKTSDWQKVLDSITGRFDRCAPAQTDRLKNYFQTTCFPLYGKNITRNLPPRDHAIFAVIVRFRFQEVFSTTNQGITRIRT